MKRPAFLDSLRRSPRKLLALLLPLALFLLGWWFGLPPSDRTAGDGSAESSVTWTCSMHPQIRQPAFGLCPICNMDLIPLDDDLGGGGLRELTVSAEAAALLDLRVAPVVREAAVRELRLFGRIEADERLVSTITARVPGRIERLFVAFTGAEVAEGEPLAEIYSPDLLVAQRELIEARRGWDALPGNASEAVRDTRRRLLEAARERLRLLQFGADQIAEIESAGVPRDRLTLHSPQAGVVTERLVSQGDYVETGAGLLQVADLSSVWLRMEAYESDLAWLETGQEVRFEVEALPGRDFTGTVAFIDPQIDPARRIAQVRVDVPNEENLLKPGMFARAAVDSAAAHRGDDAPLLVPASAVLRTGERAVVYVRLPERETPTFEGREIVLGSRAGERFIVASGLDEGELVVTRGAFKLDSELQIRAKPSMMNRDAGIEERPAHSADESLAGQWAPVPRILHRFLEDPSVERLETLAAVLRGINVVQLQPDDLALWQEFSRRLINDLEVAKQELPARPAQAAGQVARAVEHAGRHLGLPYQPAPTPSADPAMAAALRRVIEAYLPLSAALADDDDDAARQAATAFAGALAVSLPTELEPLRDLAAAVVAAEDIGSRRAAFQPVSDTIIENVRRFGIDAVGEVYVVHCPMAFRNQGADWLWNRPEVLNPYFGDAMLTCGTVTDTLSIDPAATGQTSRPPAPAADPHEGH